MNNFGNLVSNGEFNFGPFFFSLESRRLRHGSVSIPLKPKEADLLALLCHAHPHNISKEAIMDALWLRSPASDAAMSQTVYRLRRVLAAYDPSGQYIRTIPGFGFQFIRSQSDRNEPAVFGLSENAFRYFQRGVFKLRQGSEVSVLESIELFALSLLEDPRSQAALTKAAEAYTIAGLRRFIDPLKAYWKAKRALVHAIGLATPPADAFWTLSLLLLFFDSNVEGAADAAERGIALSPQSPYAWNALVWVAIARHDISGAIAKAGRALRFDPSSTHMNSMLGMVLYMAGRYDEAHAQFAEALRFDRSYAVALFYEACAYYMESKYEKAEQSLNEILGLDLSPNVAAMRGCIAAKRGDTVAFQAAISALTESTIPCEIAHCAVYAAIGDCDRAASLLSYALTTKEPGLFLSGIDPMYSTLWAKCPELFVAITRGRRKSCDRCNAPIHSQVVSLPYECTLCKRCLNYV